MERKSHRIWSIPAAFQWEQYFSYSAFGSRVEHDENLYFCWNTMKSVVITVSKQDFTREKQEL